MKKPLSFLIFLVLILLPVAFPYAEQNIQSLPGNGGIPFFDSLGNLQVAYINDFGGIRLATIQDGKGFTDKISILHLTQRDNVQNIRIKKDRTGGTWLVWEEEYLGKNDIYTAQLKNGNLFNLINLTKNQTGHNLSPNMDFSLENELWAAWVNYYQNKYTIHVKNVMADQTWAINSPLGPSALTPHIIIDGSGKIWLFWVGKLRNRDEILYTHFDGQRWLESRSLNLNPNVPHITPSVSLDFNGFPHVVWSAYDGDDYEIYYANWDGYKWSQETKITNNQNIADTHPSISFLQDTIPIVAWQRSGKEKREVHFSFKREKKWSPEIKISESINITAPPQLVSSGEKFSILWQDKTGIKIILMDSFDLDGMPEFMHQNIEFSRVSPLNFSRIQELDRDKYVGFGDSITYGIIALAAAPDLGYIPRLESLIDANIKDSEVANHGIGGEETAEGLSRIDSVINAEQAQRIFLMEGTNDVKDENLSIDTAVFNLQQMTEKCLNLGMIPFLATIIPIQPWEGILEDRVRELNQKIEAEAADPDIHFVDQFTSYINHPTPWWRLFSDSTHPNEEGYQIIAETWYESLFNSLARIELDKTSLSFDALQGESNPPDQTFQIRNTGSGRLDYQISVDQQWLSVSPASGNSSGRWDEIQVSVDISNLTPGTYQGSITVSGENTLNSPQVITVQLTILSLSIGLDKTTLSFGGILGESNPSVQTFQIRNSGSGGLDYQISVDQQWLSVSPSSGDSNGEWDEIQVSVDISNLAPGTYHGNITISAENASNTPQVITVQLTILSPAISLNKTSLSFNGTIGQPNPASQAFNIRNSSAGTLNYQISADQQWLSVSPSSGDSTGERDEIQVSVDISDLAPGTYQGQITISAENTSNSPQTMTVNLTIHLPLLFSPLNFHGEKKENNSVSLREYINILKWQANPQNSIVEKYRIYIIEGEDKILLTEVDAQTFEYWHRRVERDKVYRYGLTAVDKYGRESEVVAIEF
ncbi:GDSL-type esterase/lipase family protein [Acidobacteriota bacterium]